MVNESHLLDVLVFSPALRYEDGTLLQNLTWVFHTVALNFSFQSYMNMWLASLDSLLSIK